MKPLQHQSTQALFLAVGPQQLAALIRADWRRIEPGRGGEPFMYFKLSQRYAEMMARQWELPLHGAGYVLKLIVPGDLLARFNLETVAYDEHLEYRVPCAELERLNHSLVGAIQIVTAFIDGHAYSIPERRQPCLGLLAV